MRKNIMRTPMIMSLTTLFLPFLLAFLRFVASSAKARALPADTFILMFNYERPSSSPPPPPTSAPPTKEITTTSSSNVKCNHFKQANPLERTYHSPPPPPTSSPPTHQVSGGSHLPPPAPCVGTSSCSPKRFTPMTVELGRPSKSPPPPPKPASPTHHVTNYKQLVYKRSPPSLDFASS